MPRGDKVYLPEWNLTLNCGRPVPDGVRRMGVRAHFVTPAEGQEENTFSCSVLKAVEDVFNTIVLLRPEGAELDAPLLRMELEKMAWRAIQPKERLLVSICPRDILLFEQ